MQIAVHEDSIDLYGTGFLDYALRCMNAQGSFDRYATWLNTQPVSSFMNVTNWTYDPDSNQLHYTDEETDEFFEPQMMINIDDDLVLHAPSAGNSWFFRVHEDHTVDALYVD